MTRLERAQARLRNRLHQEQGDQEQKAWLAGFNRMVRASNFQLNVEHRWPRSVKWSDLSADLPA